jgi:signal transduction histidine kinase
MDEPFHEIFLLQDDSGIILAELDDQEATEAARRIPSGSAIRVTGISSLEIDNPWNYGFDSTKSVRGKILLRSLNDIQVIEQPSWWTVQHVIYIAIALGILALIFLVQAFRSLMERWRLQAVLTERERMAQEIHDTLAQSFAGIGFQLRAVRRAIPQELRRVQEQVDLALELVRHSHKEARRSIEPLNSGPKDAIQLLPQLERSARTMMEGGSVHISAVSSGTPRPIPQAVADTLLRIGQEAIANTIRHADPSRIEIALSFGKNTVVLSVRDNGIGFVKSGNLLGFGLRSMRKRAATVSAALDVQSQLGKGTCITATARLAPVSTPVEILKSTWASLSRHLSHANE